MNRSGKMKLLLRSLLLSSLCALSSWSVSSDTLVVSQSPDVSFHEGETGNISCCWKGKAERVGIKWLKNQTLVENKTVINQSTSSQNEQANSCSVLIFPDFAIRDSGRYICKVTVEIPTLTEVKGNGTTITVTARAVITDHHNLNDTTGEHKLLSVILAVAVVVPLFLIALACFCTLKRKKVGL
ncbi:hypothetical protein CHARACLAT_025610 [Characodon lateralis]|uniref:Ig-like domain-containing protein n=1 Tax=Characodon lateralis TaxID=208331 RepID=A0ABU7DJU5_9TELE|nr:hypothetical protein [Characodon lateralis]